MALPPADRDASAQSTDLKWLAGSLQLTPNGVRRWLDALGVSAAQPAAERLLAVTLGNEIVAARDGEARHVTIGTDLDLRLLKAGADLVLIHNHPDSLGFSADDLGQLGKPGVAVVVAVGHDGSVYMAARGHRYDRNRFEPAQYAAARAAVTQCTREALASRTLTSDSVDAYFAHVISLALARAGVLEYYTELAPSRRSTFENARAAFGPLIAVASSRVR